MYNVFIIEVNVELQYYWHVYGSELQLLFHGRLKPPVVNLLSLMSGPLQRLESPVA